MPKFGGFVETTALRWCRMLSSLASASAAGSVLQQPPQPALKSISIAAGKVSVKQDPRYLTMLPFQAQKLPLDKKQIIHHLPWIRVIHHPPTSCNAANKQNYSTANPLLKSLAAGAIPSSSLTHPSPPRAGKKAPACDVGS